MAKKLNTVSAQVMKLINAEHDAFINEVKAGQSVYKAFVQLIKALPLNNATAIINVCAAIKVAYGDAETSAQLRITLINNARRVEHGGSKGKVIVRGRGRAVLLACLAKAHTLNELKAGLVDAKPEGLKEVSTGAREARTEPAKVSTAKPLDIAKIPVQGTESDAVAAACKVLAFVQTFLQPGTDATLIGHIDSLVHELAARFAKSADSDKADSDKADATALANLGKRKQRKAA